MFSGLSNQIIVNFNADLLNSKNEWHQPKIVRTTILQGGLSWLGIEVHHSQGLECQRTITSPWLWPRPPLYWMWREVQDHQQLAGAPGAVQGSEQQLEGAEDDKIFLLNILTVRYRSIPYSLYIAISQ